MPDASRPVGDLTDDQIRKRLRVPVQEAAHLLGISPEAVESRLYRGTLDKETGTDGTVYVRLHADQLRPNDEQTVDQSQPSADLVEELRARVEDLRSQLAEERHRREEAERARDDLSQQLNALKDERESPGTVEDAPDRADPPPATGGTQESSGTLGSRGSGTARGSLWRRLFGR